MKHISIRSFAIKAEHIIVSVMFFTLAVVFFVILNGSGILSAQVPDGTDTTGTTLDNESTVITDTTSSDTTSATTGVIVPNTTASDAVTNPLPTIPNAPSGLAATVSTAGTSVALRWTDNATNEDKFNIERKLSTAMVYMTLTQLVAVNVSSYTDNTASPNISYDYRVQACLSGTGCSDYATLSGVKTTITTTNPPTTEAGSAYTTSATVPLAPVELMVAAAPTINSITLRWVDRATNEDKYHIERKLSSATTFTSLMLIPSPNITNYTDNTVSAGLSYDYRIRACLTNVGCSTYATLSNVVTPTASNVNTNTVTTPTTVTNSPAGTAPSAPSSLNAAPGCGFVTLSWPASSGATYYKLMRNGTLVGSGTLLSYKDSAVTAAITYRYDLFAVNSYGMSPAVSTYATSPSTCTYTTTDVMVATDSTASTIVPPATTLSIPSAPSNLMVSAAPGTNFIPLKWTDNAKNEDKFNIERKLSGTINYVYLKQIQGANITSFVDSTVLPGNSYDYRVQACLSGTGCSPYAYLTGIKTIAYTKPAEIVPVITTPNNKNTDEVKNTNPPSVTASSSTSISTSTASSTGSTFQKATSSLPVKTNDTDSSSSVTITTIDPQQVKEVQKIENIGEALDNTRIAIEDARKQLLEIIDKQISLIYQSSSQGTEGQVNEKLENLRSELKAEVNNSLFATGLNDVSPEKLASLSAGMITKIGEATKIAQVKVEPGINDHKIEIEQTLVKLTDKIEDQNRVIKSEGGDGLFADTNNDGISDYESVHVYNLDPIMPSPVSRDGNKVITAGEKILLGYDPKSTDLVKIVPEEPKVAVAPVASTFKVAEVKLTEEKKVAIKGRALPNSYVTVYIYSTPIVVTVKTNDLGEWEYVVDKELESGEHTIYTATVNNTGKILAKSNEFTFTKTAEAATLVTAPTITESKEPTVMSLKSIYFITSFSILVIILALVYIGRSGKNDEVTPNFPQNNTPTTV